jgi:hypothetical protein
MGISEGAVKANYHNGVKKLKELGKDFLIIFQGLFLKKKKAKFSAI